MLERCFFVRAPSLESVPAKGGRCGILIVVDDVTEARADQSRPQKLPQT